MSEIRDELRQSAEKQLERAGRDCLTVIQFSGSLPSGLRKKLSIPAKGRTRELVEAIKPFLGEGLGIRRGPRSVCICRDVSDEDLVLREARRKPGLTSKQLKQKLPLKNEDFLAALNRLLREGRLACNLNKEHKARIAPAVQASGAMESEAESHSPTEQDRESFRRAYDAVSQGRRLVRIHKMREFLQWPRARFDSVLEELRRDFQVQLHGGDPSGMTRQEIDNSYQDEKGRLYIGLTWSRK